MVKALTIVIIRALAFYLFVIGLNTIATYLATSGTDYGGTASASIVLLPLALVTFAAAAALWYIAPGIVSWFVPTRYLRESPESVEAAEVVAAGTFLIGLFSTLSTAPRVAGLIIFLRDHPGMADQPPGASGNLTSISIQLVVGIALMLFAGRISLMFKRFRGTLGPEN